MAYQMIVYHQIDILRGYPSQNTFLESLVSALE